ncbi:MAG: hypothetical protein JWO71_1180 [Candidatus Acidoferrum typicum]|nr:hypothetical protein [Candidatus Acidoferrum typicum]
MGIRRIVEFSIIQLEVSVLIAPVKGAILFRAHVVGISNVLVSVHLRVVTRAERTNVASKRRVGHSQEASTSA